MSIFFKDPPKYEYFIAKNFKHSQKGLLLLKGAKEVQDFAITNTEYILLQPLMTPYMLRDSLGRYASLRVYVVVTCDGWHHMRVLYHPWMRVKFSRPNTDVNSPTVEDIATSSNNDEGGIKEELVGFCERTSLCDPQIVTSLIENLFLELFDFLGMDLCSDISTENSGRMGQMFGADILVEKNFKKAWLLEMNKAPNMQIENPNAPPTLKQMVVSATYRTFGLPCLRDDGHPYHHLRLLKTYKRGE
eukprot:CAMPEP_0201534568 /NCGR_PEP_ID=MMETSP0161_2-20130828/56648_1 /ASSEMBLY_ACC=CAM_ASM_000251 /TAXON_ID=180227 /ORGANISM="Neoparamoeba aestuarina, Strain SoJaBio B1-5/56/2" /LENGTH=245 /DNA_ID=CAMNT_0047939277 /DNA_START=103 /DNA_END=837 /DNA_ORIENTATION=-